MTVIIGRKFSNCVLLTGDTRVTYLNSSTEEVKYYDDNVKKVIRLNNKMVIAFAGKMDIIKNGIDIIKKMDISTNSVESVIQKSQEVFGASLQLFRNTYPTVRYDTVYFLAGINDEEQPFMYGFSSDDFFNKRYLVDTPYKAFPEEENIRLANALTEKVDFTKNNMEYFVKKFSEIIRDMHSDMIGKSTFSIFVTKESMFEFEVDKDGKVTWREIKNLSR
jgi:hypothetical protein